MPEKSYRYQAYLLRCWQETSAGVTTWRFSVEVVRTGEWHGFASLEAVMDFLRRRLEGKQAPAHCGAASPSGKPVLVKRQGTD